MTELAISPERVLRALEAKAEPTREGRNVVLDQELAVNGSPSGGMRFQREALRASRSEYEAHRFAALVLAG